MKELTRQEIETLGTYNSEVERGIVHTEDWKAKMAVLQEQHRLWTIERAGAVIMKSADKIWDQMTEEKKAFDEMADSVRKLLRIE